MKTLLAIAVLSASFSAFAGNDNSNGGCQGNCPTTGGGPVTANGGNSTSVGLGVGIGMGGSGGAGGQGGKGGEGGSAAVFGSGNSSVKNENSNVGLNLQGQHQDQTQTAKGGNASATGGNATGGSGGYAVSGNSSAQGNGSGNATNVNFEGSTYKEAAQTAYAPTPSGPRTSCRLFIGFGGSSTSGSLSGGIPLANDALCTAGAQIEFMNTVNKIQAQTFTVQDYLIAVCAVEGMNQMAACKK